ncbi:MAG: isocitrate/isopropylmalate family dehydrogenase [Alphaproteobacteria bacterium]|nr:isocitrate/isopropylmalate family dehydrogenase [Alphaproteobacteria bacterium]
MANTSNSKKVVLIPGEDAAPEAFHPTVALIGQLDVPIEWDVPPVGEAGIAQMDDPFPDIARQAIDNADCTLFGSTNGTSGRAMRHLRWGKKTYANVRPARWFPGCNSPLKNPQGIDLVIVRENMEDTYVGVEGDLADLAPINFISRLHRKPVQDMGKGKYALKVITEACTQQITAFACELALKRSAVSGKRPHVTSGTKHNISPVADGYFLEVARETAKKYPDVLFDSLLADDLVHKLVVKPQAFDVIVLPNLYGDLFSDAAGGVIGGLGLAPSGCYGKDYAYFESAHGSAPDIAGQNIINPTATILSAAMMLEYLDFTEASARLVKAVEKVYAEGRHLTPDQGGKSSTTEFCDAVAKML